MKNKFVFISLILLEFTIFLIILVHANENNVLKYEISNETIKGDRVSLPFIINKIEIGSDILTDLQKNSAYPSTVWIRYPENIEMNLKLVGISILYDNDIYDHQNISNMHKMRELLTNGTNNTILSKLVYIKPDKFLNAGRGEISLIINISDNLNYYSIKKSYIINITQVINTKSYKSLSSMVSGYGTGWYPGDLHVHSIYSSWEGGCSSETLNWGGYTPKEIKERANVIGLLWISLTDHSYCLSDSEWKDIKKNCENLSSDTFQLIPSEELSVDEDCDTNTNAGHLGAHFINSFIEPLPNDWSPVSPGSQEGIDLINSQSGISIINHPKSTYLGFESWDWYCVNNSKNITGIEVWNGDTFGEDNLNALNWWINNFLLKGKRTYAYAGSDSHEPDFLPSGNRLGSVVNYVYVDSLSDTNLKQSLKFGKSFISNNGFLSLTIDGYDLGSVENIIRGKSINIKVTYNTIDSCNIRVIKGIIGGVESVISSFSSSVSGNINLQDVPSSDVYYRLECISSVGNKRIYTNPIWVNVQNPPTCITPTNGMTITQNTVLCKGNYNLPNGIKINAQDVTLDCNGANLIGNTNGRSYVSENYGIWITKPKVTVKNCFISNYSYGILSSSNNVNYNYLFNNTLKWNFRGISGLNLHKIYNNSFSNNVVGIDTTSNINGFEVRYNNIYSNSAYNLVAGNYGGIIDAINNWWGTTNEAEIRAKISGNVTYIPYLTSQTDGIVKCINDSECNDNNPYTCDMCINPNTTRSFCSHMVSTCFSDSQCGMNRLVGNSFCSNNSVFQNYMTYKCNNQGTCNTFCTNSTSVLNIQTCNSNQICHNGNCINESDCDCGIDGFIGDKFCIGNNVFWNYITYSCTYPGTIQPHCSNSTIPLQIQTCSSSQICSNGSCCTLTCFNDANCNDNNRYTIDKCIYNGCNSYCNYTNITCINDTDCDDANPCTPDICINPGTLNSYCYMGGSQCCNDNECNDLNQYTFDRCNNGGTINASCSHINITCLNDFDCNDNSIITLDRCINPGTPQSYCSPCMITCFSDNDCGASGFVGNPVCSDNNVFRNYINFTCNNKGTCETYCSSSTNLSLVQFCPSDQICENGECKCIPNLINTTWSEWINISECYKDKINQSRYRIQYDSSDCEEIENKTIYEYREIYYDCCKSDIQGPFSTEWTNCTNETSTQKNTTYYIDYNYDSCCKVTDLIDDCEIDYNRAYENITYSRSCNNCTINSPLNNGKFDSKNLLLNLTSDYLTPSKFIYIDNSDKNPRWKTVCTKKKDCKTILGFSGGFHNITIIGTDILDCNDNSAFFVDSYSPKIEKTYPKINSYVNSSTIFTFDYKEINPAWSNLYIDYIKIKGIPLKSGEKPFFSGFLESYDGKDILYSYDLTDIAGNTVKTRPIRVHVDTTLPIINILDSQVSGKYVNVNINVIEYNLESIKYIDNNDKKPSWKTFCSRLRDSTCSKKISFKGVLPNIKIRVVDKAGNSFERNIG